MESAKLEAACSHLLTLSKEDIEKNRALFDILLDHLGPPLGWTKPAGANMETSRMITASQLLGNIQASGVTAETIRDYDLTDSIVGFLVEHHATGEPRLFHSVLRSRDLIGHLVHLLCIQALTSAYREEYPAVDTAMRISMPEKRFLGNIPAYAESKGLDKDQLKRAIGKGDKVNFLIECSDQAGLPITTAYQIPSLNRVSYEEIGKAAYSVKLGLHPSIVQSAQYFSTRIEGYQATYNTIIGKLKIISSSSFLN